MEVESDASCRQEARCGRICKAGKGTRISGRANIFFGNIFHLELKVSSKIMHPVDIPSFGTPENRLRKSFACSSALLVQPQAKLRR